MATRRRYEWDGLRYRDRRTGRFVAESVVRRGIMQALKQEEKRMVALAEALKAERLTLGEFQEQMQAALRELHSYAAAGARGGWRHMDDRAWGMVGQRVRKQREHLSNLVAQIKTGLPLDGSFMRRMRMYAQAGSATFHQHDNLVKLGRGKRQYRNRMSAVADHCKTGDGRMGCEEVTAKGWQDIGSLPQIGERRCLTGCECSWEYR